MFSDLLGNELFLSNATTMVLDKGLGLRGTKDLLDTAAPYISVVKFGWGSSALLSQELLAEKIRLIVEKGIRVCPGGTFFELAYAKNRVEEFFDQVFEFGFNCIEISDGTIDIPEDEKLRAISSAKAKGFTVYSEVGKKTSYMDIRLDAQARRKSILNEQQAGASKVIMEAQEGGKIGIFDSEGNVKEDFLEDLTKDMHIEDIIFEAPQHQQQVWLFNRFGPGVNLGNVRPEDVISVASLRKGIRGDTLYRFQLHNVEVKLELGVPGALRAVKREDVVVVIDSLRASTTIAACLASGISKIVPISSVEECKGDLSAGERGGHKIPGMTHTNSPIELMNGNYAGRTLYLTTTNGIECIRASAGNNGIVLVGALVNAKAVAQAAFKLANEHQKGITLLMAGRNNLEAPEDTIGATEIANYLPNCPISGKIKPIVSNDFVQDFLLSDSGRNLVELGAREDVEFCAQKNLFGVVPIYRDGIIEALDT